MLNNYLEKKIRNKIFIVKSLYSSEQYSVLEFSNLLSISQSTVYNYFFEITQILGKKVEIVDKSPCMKLDNLEQDLHKIYNTSEFLLLLKYFLKNTSEDSIANFIEDNDISRAKFYMIRKNVVEYLNNIGLNIYKNKIIGNELKKKLLLAKIEVVYGISIISFAIKKRYEKSIEQFLGNISDPYITKYNQKMFKFVLLQIIYDDSELFDFEVEIYKEFFCVPRFIKKQIHLFVIQHFTKNKIEQKENKITFLFCFFCTGVFFLKDKKSLNNKC
ncbi:TPA: helix-turn-helix domain-containing protein [Enterococcus faecalis]